MRLMRMYRNVLITMTMSTLGNKFNSNLFGLSDLI